MNQLLGFILRVIERLLNLYLQILLAVLSMLGRALARIIADLYARFTRKPKRRAPSRRVSFDRRRGNPRRR